MFLVFSVNNQYFLKAKKQLFYNTDNVNKHGIFRSRGLKKV